jgi:hypothetical protein
LAESGLNCWQRVAKVALAIGAATEDALKLTIRIQRLWSDPAIQDQVWARFTGFVSKGLASMPPVEEDYDVVVVGTGPRPRQSWHFLVN